MIPRGKYRHRCILLVAFLLLCPEAKTSSLGQAVGEHFEDVAKKDSGEALQQDKKKSETVKHQESVLNDKTNTQYSDAKDAGNYLKKESDTKAHEENDSYEGQNFKQDKAEDSEQAGFKKGHKKGHHKQGFHNSYHKDESSNKSTFFDDFNDEADQAAYNNRHQSHDDKGGRRYQGSRKDGTENVRKNYNAGAYNRQGGSGKKYAGRNNFERNKYLDDRLDHNKHHKGRNAYERGQHFDRAPHYYGGHGGGGWHDVGGHGDWNGGGAPNDWNGGGHGGDWRGGSAHSDWNGGGHGGDWSGGNAHDGWNGGGGGGPGGDWSGGDGGGGGGGHGDWGGPGYYGDDGFRHEGGYGYGPDHGYGYGQDRIDESRTLPTASDGTPVVARRRQTITIYEDPRYEDPSTGQLRRESGGGGSGEVKLEVRPSGQRYARYDDEYYVPRRDSGSGGGVETSKINRLVYNYRRE